MKVFVSVLILSLAAVAHADCCNAQPTSPQSASSVSQGSPAFCLFELPADDNGKRKWINLGIVQYIDLGRNDLRIYYGGGNFGGGYEEKIPVASAADGLLQLDRMRQMAAACR